MRELSFSMEQAVQAAKGSFENPQLSGAELRPLLSKAPIVSRAIVSIATVSIAIVSIAAPSLRSHHLLLSKAHDGLHPLLTTHHLTTHHRTTYY